MRNHPVGIFIFFFEIAASLTYLKWKRKWKDIEDIALPFSHLPCQIVLVIQTNSNMKKQSERRRTVTTVSAPTLCKLGPPSATWPHHETQIKHSSGPCDRTAESSPQKWESQDLSGQRGETNRNMCNNTKHMEIYCIYIRTSISISYCTVGSLEKHFHLL